MSYSIETLTDDCYPGTNCLINKFNIQNERQLAFVESRIVIGKTEELLKNPIPGNGVTDGLHRLLKENIRKG